MSIAAAIDTGEQRCVRGGDPPGVSDDRDFGSDRFDELIDRQGLAHTH